MNLKNIIIIGFLLFFTIAFSQQKTLSGKVVTSVTKTPVAYASIKIKGTSLGTLTNANGEFSIRVTTPKNTIRVELIGIKSKDIQCEDYSYKLIEVEIDDKSENKNNKSQNTNNAYSNNTQTLENVNGKIFLNPLIERQTESRLDFRIEKVTISKEKTIIDFKLIPKVGEIGIFLSDPPNPNIWRIVIGNKQYKMISNTFPGKSKDAPCSLQKDVPVLFSQVFEPISETTEKFDIVDSDNGNYTFPLYGVTLKNETINTVDNTYDKTYDKTPLGTVTNTINTSLPNDKYTDSYNFKDLSDFLKQKKGLILGYHKISFTNRNYALNLQQGNVKYAGGGELMVRRYWLSPVFFDFGGFWDIYKVGEGELMHYGAKMAISTILFPSPKFFIPYMGVGCHYSEITGEMSIPGSYQKKEIVASVSTLFWKAGIQSYFSNSMSILFEYNQSMLNAPRSSNQLFIGLGFHF